MRTSRYIGAALAAALALAACARHDGNEAAADTGNGSSVGDAGAAAGNIGDGLDANAGEGNAADGNALDANLAAANAGNTAD